MVRTSFSADLEKADGPMDGRTDGQTLLCVVASKKELAGMI